MGSEMCIRDRSQFGLFSATRLREVGIASNRRSARCGEYVPGPCTHRTTYQTLKKLPVTSRRKVGMTSSPHGPYGLGYTRVTMGVTKSSEAVTWSQSQKSSLSSDCSLQRDCMKVESLVIVDQHATVNTPRAKHTQHRCCMAVVSSCREVLG